MDPRIIFSRDYKLQLQVKRRVTPLSHPHPYPHPLPSSSWQLHFDLNHFEHSSLFGVVQPHAITSSLSRVGGCVLAVVDLRLLHRIQLLPWLKVTLGKQNHSIAHLHTHVQSFSIPSCVFLLFSSDISSSPLIRIPKTSLHLPLIIHRRDRDTQLHESHSLSNLTWPSLPA
jgi:hypothetical protein